MEITKEELRRIAVNRNEEMQKAMQAFVDHNVPCDDVWKHQNRWNAEREVLWKTLTEKTNACHEAVQEWAKK